MRDIKIFLKKKKIAGEKRLEKDIKILLQKKKKKDNIIWNVRRSSLTIEIIIQHKKVTIVSSLKILGQSSLFQG